MYMRLSSLMGSLVLTSDVPPLPENIEVARIITFYISNLSVLERRAALYWFIVKQQAAKAIT